MVTEDNCFNSTRMGFADMYTIAKKNPETGKRYDEDQSAAEPSATRQLGWLPMVLLGGLWALI